MSPRITLGLALMAMAVSGPMPAFDAAQTLSTKHQRYLQAGRKKSKSAFAHHGMKR